MVRTEPVVGAPVAWVTPGEPVPIRLMNTIWADRGGMHDALSNRGQLGDWLRVVGLTATPVTVTKDDLVTGLRLRDALRRLAALLTEDDRPAAVSATPDVSTAINEINTIASCAAAPRLQLRHGVLEVDTTPVGRPVPAALAAVATESIDLVTGTAATLVRACHAPGCVLYFVKDHPRREWCSAACGNRARAARHYARHSGHTSAMDAELSRQTPR